MMWDLLRKSINGVVNKVIYLKKSHALLLVWMVKCACVFLGEYFQLAECHCGTPQRKLASRKRFTCSSCHQGTNGKANRFVSSFHLLYVIYIVYSYFVKSSPNFTHIYTALIAVINTKMPDIVDLIIRRVILQF